MKVLIAGAGIGGLGAALALLDRGFNVEVYEQASELREIGAGVQISANGMRVLAGYGIDAEVAALGVEPERREVRLWRTTQAWTSFDLGAVSRERYGQPYVTVYRPDLLAALVRAVEARAPATIRTGHRVVGVQQDEDGVTLAMEGGRRARGDVLVGADGIHSAIRGALHGPDQPQFSGMIAWRGIIPRAALPEGFRRPVTTAWVGPGRHVVHYLLRGGEILNFVGVVEREAWEPESWTTPGTHAQLHADYAGWHESLHALIDAIPQPYVWALMQRPPMPRWSAGRATLLGDACHATLPFMAQGAVMAIEDGVILARALQAETGDVAAAFRRYEAARYERTAKVIAGSAANGGRFHNRALAEPETARLYIEKELAATPSMDRFDWLYRYDAATVAI